MLVKTRFCPSPTGLMHLGNLRTALFNALLAASETGCFLLRIENTDRLRSDERYTEALMQDLLWMGLEWQEGPDRDEGHGPYYQAMRQSIYDGYYQRLIDADAAYPCFCSEEELLLQRKRQIASGHPPRYPGTCRQLTEAQCAEKASAGLQPTLRFAVPPDVCVEFEDLVRGHQRFDSNDMGDFIIRRADGTPPFLFCNVLDDALMGVTHALRGEDHITNTPRQLMLLQALGLKGPAYGHIALVVGHDDSPLSKRHGSRSVSELRQEGFLASAIVNYIARLGHYYGHDECLSFKGLAEQFSVSSLAKSPAHFNLEQLHFWQKQAVAALDHDHFWSWVGEAVQGEVPEQKRDLFVDTIRPNVVFPADAAVWVRIFFSESFMLNSEQQEQLNEIPPRYFQTVLDFLKAQPGGYTGLLERLSTVFDLKKQALLMPLRIALTGERRGPELIKILTLLGDEVLQQRLSPYAQ